MDNINEIKENLKGIVKDEVRLWSLRSIEKSAMVLGVIITFFVVLVILIMGMVFGSLALAAYLNTIMDHIFAGYLIVAAADIVLAALIVLLVAWTKVPLMSNLFVRVLVRIFNIKGDEDK